jgi:hypothetical protein
VNVSVTMDTDDVATKVTTKVDNKLMQQVGRGI